MKLKLFYLLFFCLLGHLKLGAADPALSRRIKLLEKQLNELREEASEETEMPGYEPVKQQTLPTANLVSRLTNLEESVRTLTGKLEENYHQLTQLRHQLEILIGDMEVRFGENETAIKALMDSSALKEKKTTAKDPNPSHTLELPKKNPEKKSGASLGKEVSKESIKQQYLEAKTHYDSGNIAEAEAAFRAFIDTNKKNDYSASAAFWMGKIYLQLGQPKKAALTFKTGYTQSPESRRTAENLLGMAEALAKTNRKNACITLEALQQEMPNRELMDKEQINTVQTKTSQLYRQLKCGS